MPTKADAYRQMADRATESLTEQIKDWSRFLILAGQIYKYNFLDQVMVYTQRPNVTALAEFDVWSRRMGRHIRRGSKGIALLRYRDGRVFLRYVFDVADTERRENGRDPLLWQYREEHGPAVTAWLAECFGVPGGEGLDKQLITLAVRFADEHWHDFKDNIMLSVHDSLIDELDEDNVALRFRNAVTVSLSFLLLARCGFDLDSYFTKEDFACIRDFNTRDMVLALGNAVSESAGVILRQVEYAVKQYMRGKAAGNPAKENPIRESAAAGSEKPAAAPVSRLEPEAPPVAASEPPQDAPTPPAIQEHPEPARPAPEPVQARQESLILPAPVKPAPAARSNFRITDDDLGVGGPKAKYAMNAAAIRVLKQLEAEGRSAAPDEQEVLSRYVGWGGVPEAFDPDKPEWSKEYAELKSLLTEDEYASARASVLNSHYTTPIVIRAIYEALGSMGFESGNILEPACGVGNFFGCLPESMAASRLYGVELDSVSGRVAKQLYPKARISVQGYEESNFPNDFFDVAIGNVPFGDYPINDPAYNKYSFSIHNYFLCKTMDQLRPGGVMAFVTSRFTMDSKDSAARKYLAERADLLGAIRLPNNAFKANAGTDVVTDILFFQKLDKPNPALPDWVSVMENQDGYPVNSYFLDYPEMVLGCPGVESTRYGHDYTVYPSPGADLARQLHDAVSRIHGTYHKADVAELDAREAIGDTIPADPDVK